MTAPVSYRIATEVPASFMGKLLDFIHKQYLLPQKQRFMKVSKETTESGTFLSYVVLDAQRKQLLQVEVKGTTPIELKLTPLAEQVPDTAIEEAKQDVVIAVQIFEENARKATLYFAWREGADIVPEVVKRQEKSFNRLFLETQILLFLVFIVFGMLLFTAIASLYPDALLIAPLILIAVQFVFVFYSSSFITRTADWHITEANPTIHFLEYHLPIGARKDFRQTYSADQLVAIKKEVYDEILAK